MILVTGATGFIGRHLVERLSREGNAVRAAVRRSPRTPLPRGAQVVQVGDLQEPRDWGPVLEGVSCVIHLAGLAHAEDRGREVDSALYDAVNAMPVHRLAEQAAVARVRRLVFVSSSKVLGEESPSGAAWTEETPPAPRDAYGYSKLRAERVLADIAGRTGVEYVILRPPVVYGPGVRANIYELFQLVDRGVPLPVGAVHNRRSFVYVENLVDALVFASRYGGAAGRIFHVTDGEDVSTADLVRGIALALGRPAHILPVPPAFLRIAGRTGDLVQRMIGRRFPLTSANVVRLTGSHVLNGTAFRQLGWRRPYSMEEGLARTARWYHQSKDT